MATSASTFDDLPVSVWFVAAAVVALVSYVVLSEFSPLINLVTMWLAATLFLGVWAYGEFLYRYLWAGFD